MIGCARSKIEDWGTYRLGCAAYQGALTGSYRAAITGRSPILESDGCEVPLGLTVPFRVAEVEVIKVAGFVVAVGAERMLPKSCN